MKYARFFQQNPSRICRFHWEKNNLDLEIEWSWRDGMFYARPKDASEALLWSFSVRQEEWKTDAFIGYFQQAMRERSVTRCHKFGRQLIIINRTEGILLDSENRIKQTWESDTFYGAAFQLPREVFKGFRKPHVALLAPINSVELGFQKLAADPRSDYNAALNWLTNYQGTISLVDFNKISREETEALLYALWQLFAVQSQNKKQLPILQTSKGNRVKVSVRAENSLIPRRLLDIFNFVSGAELNRRSRYFVGYKWRHRRVYELCFHTFNFSFELPTAHEKIEALLLWREFLQDKLPESEIEDLLPKF